MRKLFKAFILPMLFLGSFVATNAFPLDPYFIQHYDNRNGLSNSSINYLFNDSDNMLWIATWDGLNMYDGNTFHVFNYSKENDFKSIGSNVIQNISEDKKGNIWISTIEGISRYEKRTGRFHNYFYNQHQRGSVSEQEYAIAIDTSGTVFCLSQKNGLSFYDSQTDTFRGITLGEGHTRIAKFEFDAANNLWTLTGAGQLDIYRNDGKRFTLVHTIQKTKAVDNFFILNKEIFFSSADQLFRVDNASFISNEVMRLPHNLSTITFYKDHYLLAWVSKGYDVYDSHFKPSTFLEAETKQMQGIKITSWSAGSENILWYGTDGNGIIQIYPKTKPFETVATSENGMPYNKSVRAFCEENGNLWVGTKGSGIIRILHFWNSDNSNLQKQHLMAPAELDNNAVYALKKGYNDLIYIGTDGKGLGIYDLREEKFYKWSAVKRNSLLPDFGSVYAIWEDKDHSLWLGTSGYGLVHLKINREAKGNFSVSFIEKFTFNNDDTGPANDIIYSITGGDSNHLWIGCRYGGLSLLNKKTKKFKNFKAFTYDGSLTNNDVLSVFKDSKNRIWVGTSYGLNMIEEQNVFNNEPVFRKLTTLNGLPNNTIHAIEEDRLGQIWVSTNKGLARVNPADLKIFYYQQSDGLQSNEFCDGAVWKDKQDNLFFGGTYGFNNFLPQNIHKSNWLPNLYITNVLIGGKATDDNGFIVLDAANKKTLNYTINRKDNFFELNTKALSYLNSDKCEYAYRLEGYDKAWHYAGTTGKISYSNLLPGNYTLKIKWSNGEGTWTEEVALLKVEVKQFFWLTPFAFLFYILSGSFIFYIFYRYRKNKLKIRHQLEVEHLMRTKEEEIHQNRLGFFTNIAHELQTPLTLIMGASERFMDKVKKNYSPKEKPYFLSLIHQQSSKLAYLVHQLLEFRKVEEGFFENDFAQADVTELLINLAEPFTTLSEHKEVAYEFDVQPGIYGIIDKDKVEKIMFNLLSNAFKYSGKNEQIIFNAKEHPEKEELEIVVANSGVDIPAEQLELLFNKFYVVPENNLKSDKFGTGIGLAFTRQLVNMLNGNISAKSENGWISFTVSLPLHHNEAHKLNGKKVTRDAPSYLYQAITGFNGVENQLPTRQNNKDAILEDLLDQDKKNVLIVEDEPEIRFLIKDILKDEYVVYEAEDGQEAIDLIEKIIPDIIICDVMMPRINGLELCRKIKNEIATCQIPFILLTARASEEHHMEGYEVGADAYIAKPFNTSYLRLRIRKLMEYHQRLHEIFKNNTATHINLEETEMPENDREFLLKLVKIIEENIESDQLNGAFLEKELCLSRMQLYRKLKTLTSMTPGEFIKQLRLKAAAQFLTTTHLNVTEIFYRTGFNNQSYFFREFKKRYNLSPTEYREQNAVRK